MQGSDDFAPHQTIDWRGTTGVVQYGNDRNMVVLFYMRSIPHPGKSAEAGRPVFVDVPYVRVHPPGERLSIVERPVEEEDKRRWPIQWNQFQQNKQQVVEGTPIDMLYPEQPSIGSMLKASGVHTIEQCSELSGAAIDAIGMGAQRYTNDAKRYIEMANKSVNATSFRRELDKRDNMIMTQQQQIDTLKNEVVRLTELVQSGTTMKQVERMLAGQQERPVYPANNKFPDQGFDAQTAQINATHTTREIAKTGRKAAPAAKTKRERARIKA